MLRYLPSTLKFYFPFFTLINQYQILHKTSWTHQSIMNTLRTHFTTIKLQLKQTVLMEVKKTLPFSPLMQNTKPNHAKISHSWVTVVMVKNANSLMEIMNSILSYVEICTKQRNAKISGKKDFACMEFAVNFFTRNVQKDQVIKTMTNT